MASQSNTSNFLIQIYFVLASLLGLLLIVMGSVNAVRFGVNTLIGVREFPSFMAPQPFLERFPGEKMVVDNEDELTPEQKEALEQWRVDYDQWREKEKNFNHEEQQQKREIAGFIAMLVVGIPVFAIHAPYVFGRK